MLRHQLANGGERSGGGGDHLGRGNQRKTRLAGQSDDLGRVVGRDLERRLEAGARSAGSLEAGIGPRFPSPMTSGVVSTASLAWAAASSKFCPSSIPSWIRLYKSASAVLRFSAVSLAAISERACSSDLPLCALTVSTFTTTQPKSDWTGPTTAPEAAAKAAAAALSPASDAYAWRL